MSPSKEELEETLKFFDSKPFYTPEEEKKVVRKFDLHILTFLCALYMLSYLDRGNIGNAKTAGMNKDLGMTDSQFQWLLTIFYISYIVFQWLTMLWKIFPPRFYVPCVVIVWGVISSCFAAVCVCMKSVFILAYLATICWLMWIIQSPTSSLFPAPCLVLERDLSCSTSLSYRPVSSFIQLYLYRLLAATNSGSLLPFDYTWILLSQTEPT